jgi:hypothetical protein
MLAAMPAEQRGPFTELVPNIAPLKRWAKPIEVAVSLWFRSEFPSLWC